MLSSILWYSPETCYLVTVCYSKEKCYDGRVYSINQTHYFVTDDLKSIKKVARKKTDKQYALLASPVAFRLNQEHEEEFCVMPKSNQFLKLNGEKAYRFRNKNYHLRVCVLEGCITSHRRIRVSDYSGLMQPVIVNGGSMGYQIPGRDSQDSVEVVCINQFTDIRLLYEDEEQKAELKPK